MTMTTEDRTSRLEGAYEQTAERLNLIHGDLVAIHARIDAQSREFNERFDAQSRELNEGLNSLRIEFAEQLAAVRRETSEQAEANRREAAEQAEANRREAAEQAEANRNAARQDIRNLMIAMIALWGTTIAGVIAILVVVLIQ